jgi:signal transduction histidine kinase
MFSTKPFGSSTGLGLTIVHDIVAGEFGGSIDVSSTAGKGTTFTLRFPYKDKSEIKK